MFPKSPKSASRALDKRRAYQPNGAPPAILRTVLIVDDDEFIRRGIAVILSEQPDFSVCGTAGDERTAVKLLERHRPDLLLLDLSLGHRDGLQFLKDIAGRFPDTQIIALSDAQHGGYGPRTLQIGAAACLEKTISAAQLIAALKAVAECEKLIKKPRNTASGRVAPGATLPIRTVSSLTDRELHVFTLIGEGLGTSRIAQELGLSRKTIESYREHIKLKLGYSNAEALLKGALAWVHHSPAGPMEARKISGKTPIGGQGASL